MPCHDVINRPTCGRQRSHLPAVYRTGVFNMTKERWNGTRGLISHKNKTNDTLMPCHDVINRPICEGKVRIYPPYIGQVLTAGQGNGRTIPGRRYHIKTKSFAV